jgi:hypothetical protein
VAKAPTAPADPKTHLAQLLLRRLPQPPLLLPCLLLLVWC